MKISNGAKANFTYSFDGTTYENVKEEFQAEVGRWVGTRIGLFYPGTDITNDRGFADFDWFRISGK